VGEADERRPEVRRDLVSVQAITYVLDHSEAAGSERLVLIALANHACTDKAECWPSVRLLARESRCSERTVQYALRQLEHAGRIKRRREKGQNGTTRWALVFDAATEKARPALPKKGADAAPSVEEAPESPEGADAAPGADPAGVQPGSPGGANDDAQGVQPVAPEPSRGTVREPSAAANAAAASADAPVGSTAAAAGSSSTEKSGDIAVGFYDRAAAMLVAAGFEPAKVSGDRLKLLTELRKHAAIVPRVDWAALTEQLRAGRADGTIHAATPIATLAFGLRQRGDAHLVGGGARPPRPGSGQPAPTAAQAQNRAHNDGHVIPEADEETARFWRELVDGLTGHPRWEAEYRKRAHVGPDAAIPLRRVGNVLEVTGLQAAGTWVEANLVPILDAYANQFLSARVRFVPRDVAAQTPTPTRSAA
jgi:hypothetical protein